jgi:Peptide-N-glycosidase F, C terminal
MPAKLLPFVAASMLALACTSNETQAPQPNPPPTPDPDPVVEPTPEPSACEQLGWTERPFEWAAAFGPRRRDVAYDFTLATVLGDFAFAERYLGCETYLFVPDSLQVSPLDPTPLLDSAEDLAELIAKSPPNAHYFFVTVAEDPTEVAAFAEAMAIRVDQVLAPFAEADRAWWRDHLHVVTQSGKGLGSWVGDALTFWGPGFAIDRFQRVRGFGNLADVTRFDNALNSAGQWPWRANLSYVAHEALYYNYESDRQDMLDAVDWQSVWLFYEEDVAGTGKQHVVAEVPDAATIAGFDTLLVDLSHVCDPSLQEQGNCDAWDAIQGLRLCDGLDSDNCEIELARYITTYHREGRWLADASQLLPHLAAGGAHRFKLEGPRQGHFVSLRLLFGNTDKGTTPFEIQALWEGGSWNESYHDDHPPMQIDVPADAKKVYLHAALSGHGQGGQFNCAEFCDHQHSFTVGGSTFVAEHPEEGDDEGCLKQIANGTVPNQFGTWWFHRSSWCPGKQIDPWVWDITDQVTPGQSTSISYLTNYGAPYVGGNIYLRTWVTSWK